MTSLEIARQMAVYSYVNPKDDINDIAMHAGYAPVAVINALHAGSRENIFTTTRDKDGFKSISVSTEQYEDIAKTPLNFGEDIAKACDVIEECVENVNRNEGDITRDQMLLWTQLPPVAFEVCVQALVGSGRIATYKLQNPKDKKSVYTFLTLPKNADKLWGTKQVKGGKLL